MRKILGALVILSVSFSARAQDPNFSQFFVSPMTLNPALTGKFDGLVRVAGNYRNQWPTINKAFVTYTASVDANLLSGHIPENDQFGVGAMAFADVSGNGVLKYNYFALSTAYHKSLDEDGYHQLGLGFQGTYVNKRLDVSNAHFEDMLTSTGFTGVTSEIFQQSDLNLKYFDLNLGMLYTGTTDGENNFYFGASMYHVTRPKESFKGGNYLLEPRITLQAGGSVPVGGGNNAVHFSAIHSRQANATNTVVGGAYMLNVNEDPSNPTNLYLGSWYRVGDAIIPYLGLEFGEFRLGASYDVNVSSLKPASNMRGGIEFSLIYIKKPVDPTAKRMNCPKF